MKRSALIFLWCLLQLASCDCDFNPGGVDWNGLQYDENCIELAGGSNDRLAVCLLQRISINQMLKCGFWHMNRMYTLHVRRGSPEDGLQLLDVERDENNTEDNNDGMVKVTPKDVMLSVAMKCEECKVARSIHNCPYNNKSQFKACLCCEGVRPTHIQCLHDCLGSKGLFIDYRNWVEPQYSCDAICPYSSNGIMVRDVLEGRPCHQYYHVVNGYLVEHDICSSDNSQWVLGVRGEDRLTLTMKSYDSAPTLDATTDMSRSATNTFSTKSMSHFSGYSTAATRSLAHFETTTYSPQPTTTTSENVGSLIFGHGAKTIAATSFSLILLLN
ncbi:unnamed protein product [Clonostachys solani]|uniref:Uncharacterized protein n=1 Tax=Clonostachys solani TaxID=160281 RepID=A0A9P0ERU1_9HYPO|nr:unnamed protein product [Clonostachys solani]